MVFNRVGAWGRSKEEATEEWQEWNASLVVQGPMWATVDSYAFEHVVVMQRYSVFGRQVNHGVGADGDAFCMVLVATLKKPTAGLEEVAIGCIHWADVSEARREALWSALVGPCHRSVMRLLCVSTWTPFDIIGQTRKAFASRGVVCEPLCARPQEVRDGMQRDVLFFVNSYGQTRGPWAVEVPLPAHRPRTMSQFPKCRCTKLSGEALAEESDGERRRPRAGEDREALLVFVGDKTRRSEGAMNERGHLKVG